MQQFSTKQKMAGIVHAIVMLFAYTSPFWLDWRLIILGVIIYQIQIWVLGGCVLTRAQFGRFDASFTGYYLQILLEKLGFKPSPEKIKKVIDSLAPIFILIAIVSQVIFHFKPLVRL